ncbi:hypothetical protein NB699_001541 [Xanthomonas sacchari]|uniref:Uncharacterized protein n=1 Tax=Xanthomonas sacchari TaxID=56458 RepID=A0AA46Q5E3_9XANT|nr:hypothetical protein [Xanthomonas sacchari]MCW0366558.1 hypothetical protein [Xanthomonas sacchari]MCW0440417.1 hypothetical protein [Xanthomonas sacchari]UYK87098.1 hypothetical protein NG824_11270 [Xanthomonas sacchari]
MALKESSIKNIFELLETMTKPDGRQRHTYEMSNRTRKSLLFCIAGILLGIIVIAIVRLIHGGKVPASWSLLVILPILGFLYFLIIDLKGTLQDQWRDPWGTTYKQLLTDMEADATYLKKLCGFPKALLEYALLQYRHRWGCIDGRTQLLAGDIRKLGFFPGLIVIAVAIPKLLDSQAGALVWHIAAMAGAFLLMALCVGATSERRNQVIALLEYAIAHAEPTPPAGPGSEQ